MRTNTKKLSIFMIVSGIIFILLGTYLMVSNKTSSTITGLLFGIGSGLFGVGLANIISSNTYKKNPKLYEKILIEQNDERNIFIQYKARAKASKIVIYLNSLFVIVLSAFSMPLWVILSEVGIIAIHSLSILYFINKYNKEN